MKQLHKKTYCCSLLLFFLLFSMTGMTQNFVSYAYDNAGNRISRKVVNMTQPHTKKTVEDPPAPVEEQLGERKITVYPNPTKGALAVDITGGDNKDELRILLISSQGVQLQTIKAVIGSTRVDMHLYPAGWYILRIQAGEKITEFKIIKQ